MAKLEIKPYPEGGHAILIDGKDYGEHCTKAVITLTPEGVGIEITTLMVDEMRTAELSTGQFPCRVYRVCAACQAEFERESAERRAAHYSVEPVVG